MSDLKEVSSGLFKLIEIFKYDFQVHSSSSQQVIFLNPNPNLSKLENVLKEARNSFFGLGVYLLKSKFRIEDKLQFP